MVQGKSLSSLLHAGPQRRHDRNRIRCHTLLLKILAHASDIPHQELKRACGSGGAVVDDTIEVQGDLRDRVREILQRRGMVVKG